MGSGLLADELHWPTAPRLTPTLRFGFAVDGGGCVFENLSTRFRSISKKPHCGQTVAGFEGQTPDAGDAIMNCDAREVATYREGPNPDAGGAIRNRDASQAAAAKEGVSPDAGDAIRNRDARQAAAVEEGALPDAGNAIRNRDAL